MLTRRVPLSMCSVIWSIEKVLELRDSGTTGDATLRSFMNDGK